MSSREFFEQNPPTAEAAAQLYLEKTNLHDYNVPLVYLANRLFKESREGIRATDGVVTSIFGLDPTEDKGRMVRVMARQDVAAAFFSSSIPGLLETVDTGKFPLKVVMSAVESEIQGTLVPHFKKPLGRPESEVLSTDALKSLQDSFQVDPTLADPFMRQYILPKSLQEIINMNKLKGFDLPTLLDEVARKWRPRAKIFLQKPEHRMVRSTR